ncbi:hypothetical protein BH20ACT2_BH20ACT2_15510 [soil metagenome]
MLARAVCAPDGLTDDLLRRTLDEVAKLLAALPPATRTAISCAAALVETRPLRRRYGYRRFSSLDASEARRVLDEWRRGGGRSWWIARQLRDLVVLGYYEQPEVRRALGYDPDPFIAARVDERADRWADEIEAHRRLLIAAAPLRSPAGATPARRAGAIRPGSELPPDGLDCDVVVIGSGAGGAVVAAELAEEGLSVVVLEEGAHHPTEDFTSATLDMLRLLYRDAGASTTFGRAPIQYAEGRCVGGSTVINGAMAFRAGERVLQRWANETGMRDLALFGLDDEYSRVERFLSVAHQDPGSIGRDQHLLRVGAERLGWRVVDNRRAQVHCTGCNVCTWGCPTGAKQSTLVSYLPRAVSFGADVWSGCRVDAITMRGKRAVGVTGRTKCSDATPGRPFDVRAKRVVVCCGAIQTPALLRRSGVRPPSGQVGHNLVVHPGAQVNAVFDEPVVGWQGAHQTHQVREFEHEGIVMAAVNLPPSLIARSLPFDGEALADTMAGYNRIVSAGVLVEDTSTGRVRASGRDNVLVTYRVSDRDAAEVVRATLLLGQALFSAGAATVHLPFEGVAAARSSDDLRRAAAIPIAAERITISTVHLMGTARLGSDAVHAVCDPWGAVHDTAGLFVADASLFPSAVGVNPMLTIMALATRVAGGMIDGWHHR